MTGGVLDRIIATLQTSNPNAPLELTAQLNPTSNDQHFETESLFF